MKKKQHKEIDDSIEEELNLESDVTEESEFIEEGEFNQEEEEFLTQKEKQYVWLSIFLSFVFFTVLLLPYSLFMKKIINSAVKPITIDYTEFDYNIFGLHYIYDLYVDLAANNNIKADQAGYDFSYFAFLTGGLKGTVQLVNPDLTYSGTVIRARTLNGDFDIDTINNLKNSNGSIRLLASQVDIAGLNIRMIPVPLGDISAGGIKISAIIKNGNVTLDKSRINVDVFEVMLAGNIQLNQSFNSSQLNLNLCLNPKSGSDLDSSSVFGLFVAAGGSAESSMCFSVTGTPSNPSFIKQ